MNASTSLEQHDELKMALLIAPVVGQILYVSSSLISSSPHIDRVVVGGVPYA